jgi:chromosome partitioning protein
MPTPRPHRAQPAARVTAVANQKGGVGKSTTTVNLGAALAERGRRVLLVDLDPSGGLSRTLLKIAADPRGPLSQALVNRRRSVAACPVRHPSSGDDGVLDVLPHDVGMLAVTQDLARMPDNAGARRVSAALQPLLGAYDHVLLDLPPTLDIVTVSALEAAEEALIVVEAEDTSVDGLELLLGQIDTVNRTLRATPLRLRGLVVNRLRRPMTKVARTTLEAFAEFRDILPVLAEIPLSTTVTQAVRPGVPVVAFQPASAHAVLYRGLATVIEETR